MKPFDETLVEEYLTTGNSWTQSTEDSLRSTLRRYGLVWESNNRNDAVAWAQYGQTRKKYVNAQSHNNYINTAKNRVEKYLVWLKAHHNDVWVEAFATEKIVANKLRDIDFDDILAWLESQSAALDKFRASAVDRIVEYSVAPESPEFKQAVSDVQSYDSTKRRYTTLTTLVKMFQEV